MTIGRKLYLSFGAMFVVMLLLAASSVVAVRKLTSHLETATQKTAQKLRISGELKAASADMRSSIRNLLLSYALRDESDVKKSEETFQSQATHIQALLQEIRPLLVTTEGRQAIEDVASRLRDWTASHDELFDLCVKGKLDEANQLRKTRQRPVAEALTKSVDIVMEICKTQLEESVTAGADAASTSYWIALMLASAAVALGLVLVVVVRQTTRSLQILAAEMAEGANQTASAASQVSSSSQSMAQGSSQQAASIEETSAATEEIQSMARKNSDSSQAATQMVTDWQQHFVRTRESLTSMVSAMGEISKSSGKISNIIKVIDEIAFQTNILALNAAVEAARAGEAGMGFAVVAEEVRNLAQRCSQAAKDTAALIEESIAKSAGGEAKVGEVATAIASIADQCAQAKILVDEVHVGSQEQARGIEQIGKAISDMEQVTQQSAANAEESAAAAEELTAQSEAVRRMVERLRAMVGGEVAAGARV